MLETKISEETAKLAKEKGFDLRFADFYCDNYKGLCTEHDEFLIVEDLDGVIYDCNNEFDEGERYYVTTQSLLQKWLREEHKIDIQILRNKPGYNEYKVEIYKTDEYSDHYLYFFIKEGGYVKWFSTYESALESALKESLKLIQ